MVVAAGVEPTLAAFSALCLCRLGYATLVKLAPVAGLAPARTRLKDETRGSLHSRAEYSRSDSHRHLTDFKSVASALGYGSRKWSRRQDLHPHWTRSELVASALGYAGLCW